MSLINDPRIPEDYPPALDDAAKCICGGQAIFHVGRGHGDVSHLLCDNPRCGRIIPAECRTVAECVELWNRELDIERCPAHSWMRQPSDVGCKPVFKCAHCPATLV